MSIHQYLDLSTGHLSEDTINDWAKDCPYPVIAGYDYGLIVSVPGEGYVDGESEVPADLRDVLVYARKQGCTMVRFDSDGDVLEELPYFDW